MANLPKWTEERTNALEEFVGGDTPVTQETVADAAVELETTARSISSKLRKMGYDVELASTAAKAKSFSEAQEAALEELVTGNSGEMTYAELADAFEGDFSAKQIQGKILSMELTSHVKPTPKQVTVKSYTDAEEDTFVEMANGGSFLEEIAEALGKQLNSVRGKALSLMRAGSIEAIPKQKNVKAKESTDAFAAISNIAELTVEQIATELGKTVRGVKTMLTRRGIKVSDYDGEARKAKSSAE